MDLALFALRVVVGLLMAGHGSQKLFGSFGGHGPAATGQFFESLGLRPGERHARMAGLGEFAGGLLLVLGLLTPLGAAAIIGVMVVAIMTVHGPKGPWISDGGYEYNAVLIAVAFALAGAGPGGWSIDSALGLTWGAGWAVLALAAGVLGGIGALISARGGRQAQPAPVEGEASAESRFSRAPADEPTLVEDPVAPVAQPAPPVHREPLDRG